MIPLRDLNSPSKFPLITYSLIIVFILEFIVMSLLDPTQLADFFYLFALTPAEISTGTRLHTLYTSIFLHRGWGHLIGNLIFLRFFGHTLEHHLGWNRFLLLFIICGVIGSFGQVVSDPYTQIPVIGASGAIAGLMGAYLILFPRNKIDTLVPFGYFFRRTTLPAFAVLGIWLIAQLINTIGLLPATTINEAYFAHLSGFFTGALLILLYQAWQNPKTPRLVRL